MKIRLNNVECEVSKDETLMELARRKGLNIPSLCSAEGAVHKASCMVCVVKNQANGQIIPSCTTYPVEGMHIETESEEVRNARMLSLELLLSDHRADCEAPCSLVCPKGLDVEQVLCFYDSTRYMDAYDLISEAFILPEIGCDTCKAPCEKACRRGTVDAAVTIRVIIHEVVEMFGHTMRNVENRNRKTDKNLFQSRIGRFTASEKERLKTETTTPSRCLHCACEGRESCKLRRLATSAGIKRPRYATSSTFPLMNKQHIISNLRFEQAKCIKCGLCVYNSRNGFTFKDRGFGMQVVLPEENAGHVNETLAELCPTGALYVASGS